MKGKIRMRFNKDFSFSFTLSNISLTKLRDFFEKRAVLILTVILAMISIESFVYYYNNGLGLAYNDARSHLDIGRRVVEGLKPGFAQLGSVWLPLPHLLMTVTIWNDFMWQSGLAGALQSMISYVGTGILIYLFLKKINVGILGRLIGVFVFAVNLNILYMQSTPMTELLLLGTMTAGVYHLILWHQEDKVFRLVKAAFFIMLSTLIRYDGWFLFLFAAGLILFHTIRKHGYKTAEGVVILFCTLAGFGIFLWLFWNQMIFKDPLYFAFGPYSADAQQKQLEAAGVLATKKNLLISVETYVLAFIYNSGVFAVLLATIGSLFFWLDKKIDKSIRIGSIALLAPLFFNVLALYLGHSALYVQGLAGNSWFNVRYGLMMVPAIAVFAGYLIHRLKSLRFVLIGLLFFVSFFAIVSRDAVTIDDGEGGSSGYNVSAVSGWLHDHAINQNGYILVSTASHDEIVFSSDLPMKRYIDEGTGAYWDLATAHPDRWVRWIILRTGDTHDATYKVLQHNPAFNDKYYKVGSFPYADIYTLKPQYVSQLQQLPVLAEK
jgi:hypothetical protein